MTCYTFRKSKDPIDLRQKVEDVPSRHNLNYNMKSDFNSKKQTGIVPIYGVKNRPQSYHKEIEAMNNPIKSSLINKQLSITPVSFNEYEKTKKDFKQRCERVLQDMDLAIIKGNYSRMPDDPNCLRFNDDRMFNL